MGPLVLGLRKFQVVVCTLALGPSDCFQAGDNLDGSCVVTALAGDLPVVAAGRCSEEG